MGLERFSLVVHDWGSVGLALAQRFPERIERLVMFSGVPFVPGFRWHRVARAWRTPLVGEVVMGVTTRWGFRRELPRELADAAWEAFDHGTQRAILKLYRASRRSCSPGPANGSATFAPRRSSSGRRTTPTSARSSAGRTPTRWAGRPQLEMIRAATGRGSGARSWSTGRRAFLNVPNVSRSD